MAKSGQLHSEFFDEYSPLAFSAPGKIFQILDKDGVCNQSLRPDLSDDMLKRMYEEMVFVRAADDKVLKLQRQGRMGTYASMKGQEACQVGSVHALEKSDWMVPAFRELGAMYLHGVPLHDVYLYWAGNEIGNKAPEGVNVLPVSIPVGTHMLHAVGLAWASKLKGEKTIAITYFSDGATSEGDFHEAMNFAGVFQTPTIFFCQNNEYAISIPRKKQTASKTLAQKAIAYGMPGIQVDGNDVMAVYEATRKAALRARNGGGPMLIEALTYRMSDHTTSDDSLRYRPKEEIMEWEGKSPILRLQKYLAAKNLWTEKWEEEILERSKETIKEEVKKMEETPKPTLDEIFQYTYKEMTPALTAQLQAAKE